MGRAETHPRAPRLSDSLSFCHETGVSSRSGFSSLEVRGIRPVCAEGRDTDARSRKLLRCGNGCYYEQIFSLLLTDLNKFNIESGLSV